MNNSIRKQIFSKADETLLPSTIIADAGVDVIVTDITTVTLNGTGSSTTDAGGITSYYWEIIEGTGYSLTTPSSSTTGISGTSVVGSIIIRLTVGDATGNSDSDTVTVEIEAAAHPLSVSSSIPDVFKEGTIDFINGEANETLTLEFKLFDSDAGDSVDVIDANLNPVIPILDSTHTLRIGTTDLDANGEATLDYSGTGDYFQMRVKIIGRSSSEEIPFSDSTTVVF